MLLLIHAAITFALVGLIWTVQLVIYPLFSKIGSEAFHAYHQRYMQRIGFLVGPLMFGEIATAGLVLFQGERSPWFLATLPLLALIWLSTWRIHIPLHRQLEENFSMRACERLVFTNWLRTVAWTLRSLFLLRLILGNFS